MATLKDPHGSVIVRRYGKVVATLKGGEHFLVEPIDGGGWNVYPKSGCDGFIEKADLQLLPKEPLMKLNYGRQKKWWQERQSAPAGGKEEAVAAEAAGFNYYAILTAASDGDFKAMRQFFSLYRFMDGGAAEGYYPETWELLHVVGDETSPGSCADNQRKSGKESAELFQNPATPNQFRNRSRISGDISRRLIRYFFATKASLYT
jgi:hypothetical protein